MSEPSTKNHGGPAPENSKTEAVQVFQALDRKDENQILAEMRGEILEDLVYDVTIGGKRVTNLSYAGVKEAIRHRGNTEILDVQTEEAGEEIRALVRVRDLENRIDVLGASSAEKGKPFAYTLAVNKAERNAFAKLIPAKWLAILVDEYLARAGQVRSGSPHFTPASAPQPETPTLVPISKDTVQMDGLRQFPLTDGLKAVGMLNVLEDQASIVPEKTLRTDDATIAGFLIPRILNPMSEKHEFAYKIVENEKAELTHILIVGKLSDQQIKNLETASRWAFSKALEKTESQQEAPRPK